MSLYRTLAGCGCGSRGFLEDRMMDIITGRAPTFQIDSSMARLGRDAGLFVGSPVLPAESSRSVGMSRIPAPRVTLAHAAIRLAIVWLD